VGEVFIEEWAGIAVEDVVKTYSKVKVAKEIGALSLEAELLRI
jgi:hypothetical protein